MKKNEGREKNDLPCGSYRSFDYEFTDLRLQIEETKEFSLEILNWDAENCVHTNSTHYAGEWSADGEFLSLACPQFLLRYKITSHSMKIADCPERFIPALDPIGDHSILGITGATFTFVGSAQFCRGSENA